MSKPPDSEMKDGSKPMSSLAQDGWKRELFSLWTHPDLEGWVVEVGKGPITMTTPEGERVTDRFGKPWQFQSLDDAYEFALKALDPDGA